ncbi:MAG TPA: MaoC family dehydratase [Pseudomonadales bacterium]
MDTRQVVARNYSEASENRIHSDEIAQRYGFRGALVPGVAVYGFLTRPIVDRLGEEWLGHSTSHLRLLKPAYDGDRLTVSLTEQGGELLAQCVNEEGTLLATLESSPGRVSGPEDASMFAGEPKPRGRPELTWESLTERQPFNAWHCQITEDANRTFAEQVGDDLPLYRTAAHPHWLLGIANRALVREYVMPAWIHVGSEIRFHALVKVADTLEVQAVPLEKWERKGHQFVKLYVRYRRDGEITTEIFHTAIFKVAE